jgi:hypothetical protein
LTGPAPAAPATRSAFSLVGRGRELAPFVAIAVGCVIAGGLLAAVTAPAPSEHTSWATAYLVLVGGVAQAGLGLGQATFAGRTSPRLLAVEVGGWNVGNAAVLVGTLLDMTAVVDLGGVLLVVTLGLLARGLRPGRARPVAGLLIWLHGYRLLVLVLVISIPVGLVLARVRA